MKKRKTDYLPVAIFLVFALIYSFYHLNANMERLIVGMLFFAAVPTMLYMLLKKPIKQWYRRNFDKRYIYSFDKPIQKKKAQAAGSNVEQEVSED